MSSRDWINYARQKIDKYKQTGKHRIIALALDRRGKILSTGINSYVKTHPKQGILSARAGNPRKHFLHAEICALVRAKSKVHTIIVIRFDKQGNVRNAKPCKICELAISEAGVKKVIHT